MKREQWAAIERQHSPLDRIQNILILNKNTKEGSRACTSICNSLLNSNCSDSLSAHTHRGSIFSEC